MARKHSLREALRDAPVGKLVADSLYVHWSAERLLSPQLKGWIREARKCVGELRDGDYDLVKIPHHGRSVSFLAYEDFERAAHPILLVSIIVEPRTGKVSTRNYLDSKNPPILHRKETFVAESHPLYGRFRQITESEELAGLLDHPPGNLRQWNALVRQKLGR